MPKCCQYFREHHACHTMLVVCTDAACPSIEKFTKIGEANVPDCTACPPGITSDCNSTIGGINVEKR